MSNKFWSHLVAFGSGTSLNAFFTAENAADAFFFLVLFIVNLWLAYRFSKDNCFGGFHLVDVPILLRINSLVAMGKCRRCGARVPIQYLSNGLCRACRKDLELIKNGEG